MTAPNFAFNLSARLDGGSGTIAVGDVLVPNSSGLYVLATTANRGSLRSHGVSLTAMSTSGGTVQVQSHGTISATVSGLGTGTASWIRVSSSARLERCTPSGSDDVVGWCETDGTAHLAFGFLTASIVNGGGGGGGGGGGSYTPPTGTGIPHITAGVQDAAAVPGLIDLKVCTLEQFGATGNNVANDSAAMTAAIAALAAGTYRSILLGARTYYLPGGPWVVPAGCSVIGQGRATVLRTDADTVVFQVDDEGVSLADFDMLGDSGTSAQIGIQLGDPATPDSCPLSATVRAVRAKSFGWSFVAGDRRLSFSGPHFDDCVAEACTQGGFWICAEYTTLDGCRSIEHGAGAGAPIGVQVDAGNVSWDGDILHCGVGLLLNDGSNSAHGRVRGQINHCAIPIRVVGVASLTAGHSFEDCHIYGGDIWLEKCTGISFRNCTIDVADYIFQGSLGTVFVGCRFPSGYPNAVVNDYLGETSDTTWINARKLDGTVPAWAEYGVASANKTLGNTCCPDSVQYVDTSLITITMPEPASWKGRRITFKSTFPNDGFYLGQSASLENIEGVAGSYVVAGYTDGPPGAVTMQSDGADWWRVA